MIGTKLKYIRKLKGVKQGELAKILSVTEATISLYETDKVEPNNKNLMMIAKHLNVSADFLLGLTDIAVPTINEKMIKFLEKMVGTDVRYINEFLKHVESKNESEIIE